jgi:hypothetical protein
MTLQTHAKLRDLRTALAILRGMELIKELASHFRATHEHDAGKRIEFLADKFIGFHGELFRDWEHQSNSSARPGKIANPDTRLAMRSAIKDILFHPEKGIFDGNGAVISKDEALPRILAEFYGRIREINPFEYGTKLTLDFFMVALGNLPAFKEVYPSGIDLRRLDKHLKKVLDEGNNVDALKSAFNNALYAKSPSLKNDRSDFPVWSKSEISVSEIPFLSQKNAAGKDCLVTIDGGLVELEKIKETLEDWLRSDRQIADFPPISKQEICEYLPKTEHLRKGDSYDIDGVEVNNGNAPLFCLGTNILTGLYSTRHLELEKLVKKFEDDKASIFKLAKNENLYRKLLVYADEVKEPNLRRTIEIGYARLSAITAQLDIHVLKELEGLTAVEIPMLFMPQAGAASGKDLIKEVVTAACGKNFANPSLDILRSRSAHHEILVKANHHGDDYSFVEPFASALRTWVAAKAREGRFNTLYDCSGINFIPGYEKIMGDFVKAGFKTTLIAYDVPIEIALTRMIGRANEIGRAVPWSVAIGKHVGSPISFMQAVESATVGKAAMFANDRAKGRHYLIAETFPVQSGDIDKFKAAQRTGGLKSLLTEMLHDREDTILKLASNNGDVQAKIDDMPGFKDGNVAYLTSISEGRQKILAIYDVERFIKLIEKGMKNPSASTLEGLNSLSRNAAFVTR